MNKNEELIHRFYSAFQKLDYETMSSCYHEEAIFRDPVFKLDSRKEIAGMWRMLCQKAKEFELDFREIEADKHTGSAHWEAKYLFSKTNRKVINKIDAHFRFRDGKIIEHIDRFNFWKWSGQALGTIGYILGWSPVLRTKVQHQARKNLNAFLSVELKS